MKIGIDARMLGQGGIGRYIEQLILNLEKIDKENEYIVFLNKEGFEKYNPSSFNFSKKLVDFKWYGIKEQLSFPNILRKHKLDLVHFPHFNVPLFYNKPFVVTVHDLIVLKFPTIRASTLSPVIYNIKRYFLKKILKHAIKKSKKIITPSEFVKDDIIAYFGLKKKVLKDKIKVTYEGPTNFNVLQTIEDNNIKLDIKNTQLHPKKYILYIGSAYPHKNLELLCKAFYKVDDLKLVLIGKKDFFYNRLENDFKDLINNKIFLTGYLEDHDILKYIDNALFYIFPSLYEGFGLPPLEVMQYKLPVLSSYESCMPEVLKDSVEYFDPRSEDSIIEAINKLKNDPKRLNELSLIGPLFAKRYSFRAMSRETLEIYCNSI